MEQLTAPSKVHQMEPKMAPRTGHQRANDGLSDGFDDGTSDGKSDGTDKEGCTTSPHSFDQDD
jgi:hypothetical protein